MKIKLKRRAGVITEFTFRAEDSEEETDLRDALVAAAQKQSITPETVLDEIERIWDERESLRLHQ